MSNFEQFSGGAFLSIFGWCVVPGVAAPVVGIVLAPAI
jgi:hypothetical protein